MSIRPTCWMMGFAWVALVFTASCQENPRIQNVQGAVYPSDKGPTREKFDKSQLTLKDVLGERSVANKPDPQSVNSSAEGLVFRAVSAIASEKPDYPQAMSLLQQALKHDPENAFIHRLMGFALAGDGQREKAKKYLNKALAQADDDLESHLLLGELYSADGEFDEAISSFGTALACTDARDDVELCAEAHLRLGETLENQGYLTAAAQCFEDLWNLLDESGQMEAKRSAVRTLLLKPSELIALQGSIQHRLGNHQKACEYFYRAYELDRSNSDTASGLIQALIEIDRFDLCEELLGEMLINPHHTQQAADLVASVTFGRPNSVMRIWQVVHENNPRQSQQIGLFLAHVAEGMGDRDQAEALFISLIQQDSTSAMVTSAAGAFFARHGKIVECLELFRSGVANDEQAAPAAVAGVMKLIPALSKDPTSYLSQLDKPHDKNNYAGHYVAAVVWAQLGRYEQAQRRLKSAIADKEDFLPAYEGMFDIHLRRGQFDQARRAIEKIRELSSDGSADFAMGRYHVAAGELDDAVAALERARSANPANAKNLLLLGDVYLIKGMTTESRQCFVQALSTDQRPVAIRKLFSLLVATKQYQEAQQTLRTLQSMGELDEDEVALMQAELQLGMGKPSQALEILEKISPTQDDPSVYLMSLRARMGAYKGMVPKTLYDEAMRELVRIVHLEPTNIDAHRVLGALEYQARNFESAAKHFRFLADHAGNQSEIRLLLADTLIRAGKKLQAIEVLQTAKAKDPSANVEVSLIALLQETDQYEEAIEVATQAKESEGDKGQLWRGRLIRILAEAGEFQKALTELDEWANAAQDKRRENIIIGQRVVMMVRAGQWDEAVKYAREQIAEAQDPAPVEEFIIWNLTQAEKGDYALKLLDEWAARPGKDNTIRLGLMAIDALVSLQKFDEALARIEELQKIDQWHSDLINNKLVILWTTEQVNQAAELANQWLEHAQDNESQEDALLARRAIVRTLALGQQYATAIEHADKYLKTHPDDIELLSLKATAYERMGHRNKSIEILEGIIKVDDFDTLMLNNVAYMYSLEGTNLGRAEQLVRTALKRGLQMAHLDTLAWILYKQGRISESAAIFDRMVDEPDDPEMVGLLFDHAGDVFYRLGWIDRAKDLWQKALDTSRAAENPDDDDRQVLEHTPLKLKALEEDAVPAVSPLGVDVKEPL